MNRPALDVVEDRLYSLLVRGGLFAARGHLCQVLARRRARRYQRALRWASWLGGEQLAPVERKRGPA